MSKAPPGVAAVNRLTAPFRERGRGERHPGDVIRVIIGTLIFAACALAASEARPSRVERNLFHLVNQLPGAFVGIFDVATQAGTLWAVLVVVGIAAVWRRPLMLRDLAVAGTLGAVAARIAKALIQRDRPAGHFGDVIVRGVVATGHGFPSTHSAVAAALATAAGPYLSRTSRRLAWAGVFGVGISRVYAGAHLPLDVIAGIALGWVVGAAVHLLLGSPAIVSSPDVITTALRGAGLAVESIVPVAAGAGGPVPFVVHTADGRTLFCTTLAREQRDSDALYKLWHFLAYRELEDEEPFATPKRAVEHEAYVMLLAARAGVTTPGLVLTTGMADGGAALVEERVQGRALDTVETDEITDEVLDALWCEVAKLRTARVAHRDLRLANVLLDGTGTPWLLDFGFGEAGASQGRLAQDVAQLLTSSAILVGADRAVASATRVLGADALREALPLLQPLALASATRRQLRSRRGLLKDLRDRVGGGSAGDDAELVRLTRIRPRTVLVVATLGVAIYLLIPQVGELNTTLNALQHADWGWLVAAVLASSLTYVAAGVALGGAVPERLAVLRTAVVELAGSFVNRFTPGSLGGYGVNVRYLQRSGIDTPIAVAALGLNTFAGVLIHVLLLAAFSAAVGTHGFPDVHLPNGWIVLVVVAVALAALGVAWRSVRLRTRIRDEAGRVARDLADLMRTPRRGVELFGGAMGVTLANIVAFAAALAAFGIHVQLARVGFVYLAGAAVSSAAPTPGGLGAIEASLVAGLTATGVASGPAVAGVLAFRLATFWLPTLPGWIAFRRLRRADVI
ncbi:MAG: flippase-like domain-containing protein [Actinobacteria bacterium]|nr:flippase-like domain-containing protein [Actinomycetota bacterium]